MRQIHDFDAATTELPRVEALPPRARFNLRVREPGRAALGEALGLDLPTRIGDRAGSGGREALCLGPDEWLIDAEDADAPAIAAALADRYAQVPHAATDICDRELHYRLSGHGALALLAMGCPRDLARLEPGRAARTIFHGASVVVWRDGPQEFRIDVWRSFVPHVRALLDTGLRELRAGL